MKNHFIGRDSSISLLQDLIRKNNEFCQLSIQSIEGIGGVGKSTLLEYAIPRDLLDHYNYLVLKVDGTSTKSKNIYEIVFDLISSAKSDALQNKEARQIFPNTMKVIAEFKYFQMEVFKQFNDKNGDEKGSYEEIKNIVNSILNFGKGINKISPKTKDVVDVEEVEGKIVEIKEVLESLDIMKLETPNFLQKLTLFSKGIELRNSFRNNSIEPLKCALFQDLSAILIEPIEKSKAAPMKIKGIDRLLLIVDDYEALYNYFGDFFFYFLKDELKDAKFQTVAIILGRDSLASTATEWKQHLGRFLRNPIVLRGLEKHEVIELANIYDIDAEKLWEDTKGHPFYIDLWKDAQNSKLSSTKLRQFYERTTKWLDSNQKKWLEKIVFLDVINIQTIEGMGFNADVVHEVFDWFSKEGSLRNTEDDAGAFEFIPFIRSHILSYIKIVDSQKYKMNKIRAREVMQEFEKSETEDQE
ncbi:ATP-binding protein [Acinetobacter venetianus]|uniref:ATP-binding protein n=1 Tax=Acinetobacter venetianus TaxID=52133 RepID=UPI001023571F|nr:ATP-binding protein [Acinetobacter venetianus]RZG86454.1 ATP-binding protein [Acinetobacter venetianus]